MKRYFLVVTSLVCLLFTIHSCTSKELSFTVKTTLSYSEKTFSVNNHTKLDLETPTGLKIHIPASAFVNKTRQPVADNIMIEVKEILRPDAMILNDMPTVSNGRPLESAGEFFIGARSGNEQLELAAGFLIQLDLPDLDVNMNGMQVFNGKRDASTGYFNWQLNTNPGNDVIRVVDSSNFVSSREYYSLFSDNLDWINVDKILNEPTFRFDVSYGNTPNIDSTAAYLHLSGRNSVLNMYWSMQNFSTNAIAGPATLVGICRKNGELYASISKMMIHAGQTGLLNFTKMTEGELKQKLKVLR
jgi:hypothetical protein